MPVSHVFSQSKATCDIERSKLYQSYDVLLYVYIYIKTLLCKSSLFKLPSDIYLSRTENLAILYSAVALHNMQ